LAFRVPSSKFLGSAAAAGHGEFAQRRGRRDEMEITEWCVGSDAVSRLLSNRLGPSGTSPSRNRRTRHVRYRSHKCSLQHVSPASSTRRADCPSIRKVESPHPRAHRPLLQHISPPNNSCHLQFYSPRSANLSVAELWFQSSCACEI